MRTYQGSSNDLLNRNQQGRRDIDLLISSSPNGWRDPTVQNNSGYISRDKYNQLKELNSKLKNTLREYIQDSKDKDRLLQTKEEQLIKYEKERGELQNKGNEELKTQYNELKIKLQKKKTKIRLLKDSSKTIDSRLDDQKAMFQVDLDKIQRINDSLQIEIKEHEKRYIILKDENAILKQALQQKEDQCKYFEMGFQDDLQNIKLLELKIKELQEEKKILQIAIDNLTIKNDETEKFIKLNDQRYQQDINKVEQEKQQLQNEYLNQINRKKDKTKSLLNQIQQLELQITKQQQEELSFNKLIQEQKQEYLRLQQQLEDQRNKTDQSFKELNFKVQEIIELKSKLESQKSLLQSYEDKLAQYDLQYQLDQNEKSQMLCDIDQFHQEYKKFQHLLYESDKEIAYLKQQHQEDLYQIENRVESLIHQLNESKDETQEQKKIISELKKQLISCDEQANAYKNKYLKVKQNQKTLQSEQKYLEEKVKLMESERVFEEKEALKTKDYVIQQKQVQQSKIKVLDEIQSMIKQHKKINS